jgi:hypothetical protein
MTLWECDVYCKAQLKLQEPIEHLQVIHGETMLYVMIYDDYMIHDVLYTSG